MGDEWQRRRSYSPVHHSPFRTHHFTRRPRRSNAAVPTARTDAAAGSGTAVGELPDTSAVSAAVNAAVLRLAPWLLNALSISV